MAYGQLVSTCHTRPELYGHLSVFSDCIFQDLFNHTHNTHKPLTINKVWCLYIKYLIQIADPKAEPVLVLENS
jgi:hypothetical protein